MSFIRRVKVSQVDLVNIKKATSCLGSYRIPTRSFTTLSSSIHTLTNTSLLSLTIPTSIATKSLLSTTSLFPFSSTISSLTLPKLSRRTSHSTNLNVSRRWKTTAVSSHLLSIKDEIKQVLSDRNKVSTVETPVEVKSIVALDTTILSRTFPYPENLQLMKKVCKLIRDEGSIPAPIALIDGKMSVGLNDEEMDRLAQIEMYTNEASRREIALSVSSNGTSRTTLSAAIAVADMIGIKVIMTGSIGGVMPNLNQDENMDISTELVELGRTAVAVVCAGLSPTVHVDNTIQYFGTSGVTTVTFGESKNFPVFGCKDSGNAESMANYTDSDAVANLLFSQIDMGLESGIVIAIPAPSDVALDYSQFEGAIHQAVVEADTDEVASNEMKGFLMGRVMEIIDFPCSLTESLYLNNAQKAAEISKSLNKRLAS